MTRASATWARVATVVLVGCVLASACGGPDADGTGEVDASGDERSGVFGVGPRPSGGVPAVVTLTPIDGAGNDGASAVVDAASAVLPSARVDQFGLQFSPTTALVRVGGTVSFTNSEASLTHNVQVRSTSGGPTLLDEDAVTGGRIDLTLSEAGGYDVTCEMHPGMTAFVYATPAPYAVFADNDGSFHFDGVPPGRYEMRVWSADPDRRTSGIVEVGEGATDVPPFGGTNPGG